MINATCHPERKHIAHGLCASCYSTQWSREHSERRKGKDARYRMTHKKEVNAHSRASRLSNPLYYKVYGSNWRKLNKGLANFYGHMYRARRLKACPAWADPQQIKNIYKEAARMRTETGLDYEVDHIIPLCSPYVCGLHVPENLQIILQSENASKSNKFWGIEND